MVRFIVSLVSWSESWDSQDRCERAVECSEKQDQEFELLCCKNIRESQAGHEDCGQKSGDYRVFIAKTTAS